MATGGLLRDSFGAVAEAGALGEALAQPVTGYAFVYAVEIVLLIITIIVMRMLTSEARRPLVALLPAMAARLVGE
jgi:BCD family chlorophyll transporter-like MFS transporter